MKKHPFIVFLCVIGVLIFASVTFMQSQVFAKIVKAAAARYIPVDLGIAADFTQFGLRMFPPAISVINPRVTFQKTPKGGLPAGSSIEAERIDLEFTPFQLLSGNVWIDRVAVSSGKVEMRLNKDFLSKMAQSREKKAATKVSWSDLLQIRARAVGLEDVELTLWVESPGVEARADIRRLDVRLDIEDGAPGYSADLDLQGMQGTFPKDWSLPSTLGELQAKGFLNEQGLRFESLSYAMPGLSVSGDGNVRGDFLSFKQGSAEARLQVKGSIDEVIKAVPKASVYLKKIPAKGEIDFNGRIAVKDLQKPEGTAEIEGRLQAKQLQFREWRAESALIEGSWASATQTVKLKQAMVHEPFSPRVSLKHGAAGGTLRVDTTEFRLSPGSEITIPVKLEKAHFHWLAAPIVENIFLLDFFISGAANAKIAIASDKSWSVSGNVDLQVDQFLLDNQKLKIAKPKSEILNIPKIFLKGGIVANEKELTPKGLRLSLPGDETSFDVGGRVDFEKGLDLKIVGGLNTVQVDRIVEQRLRGVGTLTTLVHGPFDAVVTDFDFDLKDAEYLGLFLGDAKGRITLDDKPNVLRITGVEAKKGRSVFRADGEIDLKKEPSSIRMQVSVAAGSRIEDGLSVFEQMTRDIDWLPRSLRGEMRGKVSIGGDLDLKKLTIMSSLSGSNWEYFGERFRRVAVRGGYDKGDYVIQTTRISKGAGFIDGRIRFSPDSQQLEWQMQTAGLGLGDFDRISGLKIPIRGPLRIQSEGSGKMGAIESFTLFDVSDMTVQGVPRAGSQLSVRTSGGKAMADGSAFNGQGLVALEYDFKKDAKSKLSLRFTDFDLTPFLFILNPSLLPDTRVAATVSAAATLDFLTGSFDQGSGSVLLESYQAVKTGAHVRLARPLLIQLKQGSFERRELAFEGTQGELKADFSAERGQLRGGIRGVMDLSLFEFVAPVLARAAGPLRVDLALGGILSFPTVEGDIEAVSCSLKLADFPTPIEEITGNIGIKGGVFTVQNLKGAISQGTVSVGGAIELFADRMPLVNLSGSLKDTRLAIYPFQFIKTSGKLTVTGPGFPYLVKGQIHSDSALTTEKVLGNQSAAQLKSARFTPPQEGTRASEGDIFHLDLDVSAPKGIEIRNDLFVGEAKAEVKISNSIDSPRIVGRAEMITGKLLFNDREFVIQSASLNFDTPTAINPRISLVANTVVNAVKVSVFASGRFDSMKLEFTSDPSMSETEITQLLAMGVTSDDLKRFRTGDGSNVKDVVSLLLNSLDFNREFKEKTGLQLQLDEASDAQVGQSAFRPRDETATSSPKVVIRRQIGSKFEVSVGSTLGVGTSTQRQFNAEYRFVPNWSVLGVFDSLQGVETQQRTSWGFDLKYQKRFK